VREAEQWEHRYERDEAHKCYDPTAGSVHQRPGPHTREQTSECAGGESSTDLDIA